jgi:hypothetical protein
MKFFSVMVKRVYAEYDPIGSLCSCEVCYYSHQTLNAHISAERLDGPKIPKKFIIKSGMRNILSSVSAKLKRGKLQVFLVSCLPAVIVRGSPPMKMERRSYLGQSFIKTNSLFLMSHGLTSI